MIAARWLREGLARFLPLGSAARSAATLVTATAVAQGIGVAASPVLTRLYGPESYGVYGLWLALLAPVGPLLSLRYELAIVPAGNDEEALALARLAMRLTLAMGGALFIAILVWELAVPGPSWLGGTLLLLPAAATAMTVLATGAFVSNRAGDYARIGQGRVAAATVGAGVQVVGGMVLPTPLSLAAGRTLGLLSGALLNSRAIKAVGGRGECSPSRRDIARRHRNYPLRLAPAHVMGAVAQALPIYVVGAAGGAVTSGYYALGVQVFALPSTLIAGSLGDVFRERAASSQRAIGNYRRVMMRTLAHSVPAGVAVAIGGAMAVPLLVVPVIGDEWAGAQPILQALAVAAGLSIALTPTDEGALVSGRLTYAFVWQFGRLAGLVAIWSVVAVTGTGPVAAVWMVVATSALLYTVDVVLTWRWSGGG